jgi:hypothetical protein
MVVGAQPGGVLVKSASGGPIIVTGTVNVELPHGLEAVSVTVYVPVAV